MGLALTGFYEKPVCVGYNNQYSFYTFVFSKFCYSLHSVSLHIFSHIVLNKVIIIVYLHLKFTPQMK